MTTLTQIAQVTSRLRIGLKTQQIVIETHLMNGLPNFIIIGLPDNIIKESKERVRSAIINCGFVFPIKRIVLNLAPAEIPKNNSHFDLPIAIAILAATGQIPSAELGKYDFVGELSLSGGLNEIQDCFLLAHATAAAEKVLIIPAVNKKDITMLKPGMVLGSQNLKEVCEHLQHKKTLKPHISLEFIAHKQTPLPTHINLPIYANKALVIAATGMHHIMALGSPNSGKKKPSSFFATNIATTTKTRNVFVKHFALHSKSNYHH
jgi:magnesium chelatase family protein